MASTVEDDDVQLAGAPESLAGKVLIDPPDFDSANTENRLKLLRLMAVSDLVLVIGNRIKYRHAELFDLVKRYRKTKAFAFVLNGIDDPLFEPPVLEDYRSALQDAGIHDPANETGPIFAISARVAYESRCARLELPTEAGDFPQLENFITRELHQRRIREIKTSNLQTSCDQLLESLHTALGDPGEQEAKISRLEEERIPFVFTRFHDAVVRRVRSALFDDAMVLDRFVEGQGAQNHEGVFGLYVAAMNRIRHARGGFSLKSLIGAKAKQEIESAKTPSPSETKTIAEKPKTGHGSLGSAHDFVTSSLGKPLRRGLRSPIAHAVRSLENEAKQANLEREVVSEAIGGLSDSNNQRDLADSISAAVQDALEKYVHINEAPPSSISAFIGPWNIAPNLLIAIGFYHAIAGFFHGEAKFGILLFGVLLAFLACVFEFSIYDKRLARQKRKLRLTILDTASEAFSRETEDMILLPLEKSLESARRRAALLRNAWVNPLGDE